MITIKIPIKRLVGSEQDGFARLLGYMRMYSDQAMLIFQACMAKKAAGKVVVPAGLSPVELTVH